MAGEVDMMFNGMSPAIPHIKSGRVRALAVGGGKRSSLLPELPTVKEAGFEFNTEGWYGILAPRGTPPAIVTRLHEATVRALASPALKSLLEKMAVETVGSSPAEFERQIREESALWAKVIKAAGIKAQ
jgi:tripartite-type tricarboxylate transporter receptor subunit TctC